MQGILIVDKPTDWTSFDVIAKLRGILGTRKLGHSGTLDPMATGVLPVFCGGASKAVDLQLDHDKTADALHFENLVLLRRRDVFQDVGQEFCANAFLNRLFHSKFSVM